MELETFGEPACESEVTRLDGQYSRYYFHHTEFSNLATDPRSYLFISRRGSGKTAHIPPIGRLCHRTLLRHPAACAPGHHAASK